MFVERKLNPSTGAIGLWWCDWEKGSMAGAKKTYIKKIADEAVAVAIPMDSVTEEVSVIAKAPTLWVTAVLTIPCPWHEASPAGSLSGAHAH
jgi:hypothetical protein